MEQKETEKIKKKFKKRYIVIGIILLLLVGSYLTFVYSDIPFIKKWRTIYIETAMTTNSHQWLATWFIPHDIIESVMQTKQAAEEEQRELESKWDIPTTSPSPTPYVEVVDPVDEFMETYWELDSKSVRKYLSEHQMNTKEKLDNLIIDDMEGSYGLKTKKGDTILSVNIPNSLVLVAVEGDGYVGKLAIIKDPSLICASVAKSLGYRGEIIDEHAKNNNAILAINASGFQDKGGHGSGGQVSGSLVVDGVEYGNPNSYKYKFFGMKKKDNKLYIGDSSKVDKEAYRWGVEFFPALVVDGKCIVAGTYGLGIQPRTAIGQAKDGTVVLLVVDGRQVGYSLGCTMEECANQLLKYKVYQAANMDGGSSSIMWYNGAQVTRSSSPTGFGRYLPDSIYVKKVS